MLATYNLSPVAVGQIQDIVKDRGCRTAGIEFVIVYSVEYMVTVVVVLERRRHGNPQNSLWICNCVALQVVHDKGLTMR